MNRDLKTVLNFTKPYINFLRAALRLHEAGRGGEIKPLFDSVKTRTARLEVAYQAYLKGTIFFPEVKAWILKDE